MDALKLVRSFEVIYEARRVLKNEIQGLETLSNSIDERFEDVIALLTTLKGKVILTGMGKSGHIARKIAATLTSTGTLAQFLHPAEASHGDLGLIAEGDVILALSSSGETKELSDIIAFSKAYDIPLVGITQNPTSTLALQSRFALIVPKVEEACPNRLAPTTSTTMMLALGDAIAVTLMRMKGFSASDFRAFHPGGTLGAQLRRVKDLMLTGDALPVANINAPMSEVLLHMTKGRLGCVAILHDDETLAGVITDGDLRRHMNHKLLERTAGDVMTTSPKCIDGDAMAVDGLKKMKDLNITNLFILSPDKKPVGVLNLYSGLQAGLYP